jgi:NAD-dependent SIR2 family protein deacetylase
MANGDRKQRQDVVFFFGAGASVDAGIPDTYEFVEDFKNYIQPKASDELFEHGEERAISP